MRKTLILFFLAISSTRLHALVLTTIEPIMGYERVQKLTFSAHTKDRLVFGGRITAGLLAIAAETEYLHSSDNEDFSSLSIRETTEKARLGFRSCFQLFSPVYFLLRVGGQAKLSSRDQISGGVTSKVNDLITYNPYAGAGLRIGLGSLFAINMDLTTVFDGFTNINLSNNEYVLAASFAIQFP
jgi:hypothetical protein